MDIVLTGSIAKVIFHNPDAGYGVVVLDLREPATDPVLKMQKNTVVAEAVKNDPVELAHQRCVDLLASGKPFQIDEDRAKAIDKVVESASKELSSITGAME